MKHFLVFTLLFPVLIITGQQIPAFPGAEGFGKYASGGRGGRVIYVTNLNANGPGSLQEALNTPGPSYILFKVSGVIPATVTIPAGARDITIAGQTSPGGIIVRGLSSYNEEQPNAYNLIIRHLRLRSGDLTKHPSPYWISGDGLTLGGVEKAIIDHCSMAHAWDEAVDISRSSAITIQHSIFAETLGDHAYLGGMLINYSSPQRPLDSISLLYNNWNRMGGRMPEISCESVHCENRRINIEMVSNLLWDPGIETWYTGETGTGANRFFYLDMNIMNNLSIARPSYTNGMFHIEMLRFAANRLFVSGNRLSLYPNWSDYQLFYCCNDFHQNGPNDHFGACERKTTPHAFPVQEGIPVSDLTQQIIRQVGAFPRDPMDNRLIGAIATGQFLNAPLDQAGADDAFLISNSDEAPTDSDSDGMPDSWEIANGLNPMVQDHNGTALSLAFTGVPGYTNLECYLNCLADSLVSGIACTPVACDPCPSCDDGIQNQDETGIDCGGQCEPCTTAETCPAPKGLFADPVRRTTARLNWESDTNADRYKVQIRRIGDMAWTTFTTTYPFITIRGMVSGRQYEWRVSSICDNLDGEYSYVCTFTGGESDSSVCDQEDNEEPAPTCTDNIQNGDETGIDCGGNCLPCPSCSDGIQNQDETGVDCGGVCGPCPVDHACLAPTGLFVDEVLVRSMRFNWDEAAGATGYVFRIRLKGSTIWREYPSPTNFFRLSNLSFRRTYEWQVATICPEAGSDWSPTCTATAGVPGNTPCGSGSSNAYSGLEAYPNPAHDVLHISIRDPEQDGKLIRILDFTGREVMRLPQSHEQETYTLDTGHLPGGVYFITCGKNVLRIVVH
ncbi:MAG: fibronectin type III domain-containing protein [Saprospiraceae bacterium]|nr:fibronectin type III domain-containing protein [Saprospiraceae bacterium]